MGEFQPDYTNIVKAAWNIEVQRIPLYEHKIDPKVMEAVTGKSFADYYNGDDKDLDEFFRCYCGFYRDMGYDTVSFEELIGINGELKYRSIIPTKAELETVINEAIAACKA